MIHNEQMTLVLEALPDPAFILSKSGKYIAVFGGKDSRYYHDGSNLVGLTLDEVLTPNKANWFLSIIERALSSKKLQVEEYELSNKDVKGLPDEGPAQPIWFEGRIQALDFLVDDEEVVLWVASNISQRHEFEIQLRELSDTDQLTGLFNRRRLERDLTFQYDSLQRYGIPTAILMLDLDHLKLINDKLGHQVGDETIVAVAKTCRIHFRKTDSAYRYGGDEFVISLPGTNQDQSMAFAEHLRLAFNDELQKLARDGLFATVSIGVATIEPQDDSYEDTLKRADIALYQAKHAGKNRVAIAQS
ncbi:sensor domain-containing diguanylate cyclase [Shewanella psychrotolerans]|uniref:sensor domain-containing diguanylate cyclase n=1 Tax=Shewanella psychrotolerans TaxID=2864206 RepID=UPI001C660911|nr:sensor domain-containing diguanylate cyclase [Shewanella psychrotolerans]QYK02594.1 GGDEF domain-containing protein [Shewanella psychrotolerans]